jgi:hypothetical protein
MSLRPVERSLEREPLVAAGTEFGLLEAESMDAIVFYICLVLG